MALAIADLLHCTGGSFITTDIMTREGQSLIAGNLETMRASIGKHSGTTFQAGLFETYDDAAALWQRGACSSQQ
jgi:hypothetical protein